MIHVTIPAQKPPLGISARIEYSKYVIRYSWILQSWHDWCPFCKAWQCCKDADEGFTTWAQAAHALALHRKVWHT